MVFVFINNATIENGDDGQGNNGTDSNQQEIARQDSETPVNPDNNEGTNGDGGNTTETEGDNMESTIDPTQDE